jgi:hypothetical protein
MYPSFDKCSSKSSARTCGRSRHFDMVSQLSRRELSGASWMRRLCVITAMLPRLIAATGGLKIATAAAAALAS